MLVLRARAAADQSQCTATINHILTIFFSLCACTRGRKRHAPSSRVQNAPGEGFVVVGLVAVFFPVAFAMCTLRAVAVVPSRASRVCVCASAAFYI